MLSGAKQHPRDVLSVISSCVRHELYSLGVLTVDTAVSYFRFFRTKHLIRKHHFCLVGGPPTSVATAGFDAAWLLPVEFVTTLRVFLHIALLASFQRSPRGAHLVVTMPYHGTVLDHLLLMATLNHEGLRDVLPAQPRHALDEFGHMCSAFACMQPLGSIIATEHILLGTSHRRFWTGSATLLACVSNTRRFGRLMV